MQSRSESSLLAAPGSALAHTLLWLACSSGLATLSLAIVVLGIYGLARGLGSVTAENLQGFEILLLFYFKLVCLRGILPSLVITISGFELLKRLVPAIEAGRARLLAGLAATALVAYALVAPLLLMAEFEGAATLQARGLSDHLGSALGIVGGTVLAAWLPRLLVRSLRLPAERES